MGLTVADAYAQIKKLENSGQITLPETQDTVVIGTIDPKAGTFKWSVPTVVQTTTLPPGPGQKTNTTSNVTTGVVSTNAIDLLLKFAVIPQTVTKPVTVSPKLAALPVAAPVAAPAPQKETAASIAIGSQQTNGGVTISGFLTVSSAANQITVDAGLACSAINPLAHGVTPPVTTSSLIINIPGHQPIGIQFFVLRPPSVGMGAFTIPALPMSIVYAPPQGKQLKNTASYADLSTVSRTVSSSITSSNNTKSVQAFSVSDLIGKVVSAITTVAAVVGGDPTGGGGASVAGAFSELSSALFGPAQDASSSTADASKQITSELSLVSEILSAVSSTTSTSTGTLTTQSDHSLTMTVTNMSLYSSESTLGPGLGDRIIYMSNVKVVWMAVNGEVGIYILGFDGVGANGANDLLQEEQAIAGGATPTLGLDVPTIQALLGLDPLVTASKSLIEQITAPIGPPRFLPSAPPGRKGSGTGSSGDTFTVSFDAGSEDKETTTNTQTTITDAKPGWVSVLFGADNVETTATATFTTSSSTDDKSDDKLTSTITLFSQGLADPYDVKIFYDCSFGTYVIVDSNSSVLQGVAANRSSTVSSH